MNTTTEPKVRGPYNKMSLQLDLFGTSQAASLNDDQVAFYADAERLRDTTPVLLTLAEQRQLAAEIAIEQIEAVADDPWQLYGRMGDSLPGFLEDAGINFDAFLDQVKKNFPNDPPKEAFQKFCARVVENLDADFNTVAFEEERVQLRLAEAGYSRLEAMAEAAYNN